MCIQQLSNILETRALQDSLGADKKLQALKAQHMLVYLENRCRGSYHGKCGRVWFKQDLHAILVGHVDDLSCPMPAKMDEAVERFLKHWWGRFLPVPHPGPAEQCSHRT